MKPLFFLGDSRSQLQEFPAAARRKLGFELGRVQLGKQPHDSKPLKTVGAGVEEIRIWVESGTYRVVYLARLADAVYVLHAFAKKTEQTSKRDLALAKRRLENLTRNRA